MTHQFKARIRLAGINPCVNVPARITTAMTANKGYIAVKGHIEGHPFIQTLVPVKNGPYRLYVNGPMLKGAKVKPGEVANFEVREDKTQQSRATPPMPRYLKEQLSKHRLTAHFMTLTPTRQKMIITYLTNLKTDDAVRRNVGKLITAIIEEDPKSWMTRK